MGKKHGEELWCGWDSSMRTVQVCHCCSHTNDQLHATTCFTLLSHPHAMMLTMLPFPHDTKPKTLLSPSHYHLVKTFFILYSLCPIHAAVPPQYYPERAIVSTHDHSIKASVLHQVNVPSQWYNLIPSPSIPPCYHLIVATIPSMLHHTIFMAPGKTTQHFLQQLQWTESCCIKKSHQDATSTYYYLNEHVKIINQMPKKSDQMNTSKQKEEIKYQKSTPVRYQYRWQNNAYALHHKKVYQILTIKIIAMLTTLTKYSHKFMTTKTVQINNNITPNTNIIQQYAIGAQVMWRSDGRWRQDSKKEMRQWR